MKNRLPSDHSKSAFSLIELLVVIAIIGIIGAFAVPAVGQLLKGSSITQAANMLTDQTSGARQHALTKNRTVEVRFYKFTNPSEPGGTPQFRAVQYFEIGIGGIPNPVGKYERFPETVVMSSEPLLSSILDPSLDPPLLRKPGLSDVELPGGVAKNYSYVFFRFQPDGTTSLSPTGGPSKGQWFITAHLQTDTGRSKNGIGPSDNQVHNFFTWIIDPVSGNTKVLRPGVK